MAREMHIQVCIALNLLPNMTQKKHGIKELMDGIQKGMVINDIVLTRQSVASLPSDTLFCA